MKLRELILFIDNQNVYKGAREAFFSPQDHHSFGQINPMELAKLICKKTLGNATLKEVRIYSGRPDPSRESRTYAAHMKQCGFWTKVGATVITHPLRYPRDWPNEKAQEKGVDVALAVDFVIMAVNKEYDIGIIASTDTDMKPALEFVYTKYRGNIDVAVVAWISATIKRRLSISSGNIWCHSLGRADYDSVADLTDYNI
jgi:uncharacterized LabA/DUF88 family protein